jgi:hypothetical protein
MKKIIIVALCGIGTIVSANGCAADPVEQNDDVVVETKADTVGITSGVWVLGPKVGCGGAYPTCVSIFHDPCDPVGSQTFCKTQGTTAESPPCTREVGNLLLVNCQ